MGKYRILYDEDGPAEQSFRLLVVSIDLRSFNPPFSLVFRPDQPFSTNLIDCYFFI